VTLALITMVVHIALAIGVSAHIILTKDDVRAAIGWVGLVWLAPVVGSFIYMALGVNRMSRRADAMRGRAPLAAEDRAQTVRAGFAPVPAEVLPPDAPAALHAIARLVGTVTRQPLTPGCAIEPLMNGDEAYPAMIAAIDAATRSVGLGTYIFDRGVMGQLFVEALHRAVLRGVAVRVLIDGVGARYSHPPITRDLQARKVPVARFLPSIMVIPHPYLNLRNHRKLMVIDGALGFCGGLNIRDDCLLALHRPGATQDIHFRLRGPIVAHLLNAFRFDWEFTTREHLTGPEWAPSAEQVAGPLVARGIPDGPDENFETLYMTILGALAEARHSVRIVTPYFLPDQSLVAALRVAALRGVQVDIVLPERGNLRLVQWAVTAQLPQVMSWGCRVYVTSAPFDHSKLMVVDSAWSLVGSSNWDPRSLRLNFEYDVECYSPEFARTLDAIIDAKIATGRILPLGELESRSIATRLRDGVAWLGQPYL
jgi:cardiolipin synthase A/B